LPGSGSGSAGSGGVSGSGSAGSTTPGSPGTPTQPPSVLDAGAPTKPQIISCGGTTCAAGAQVCCIDPMTGGSDCVAGGSQCQGIPLSCSSGATCGAGQICCFEVDGVAGGAASCVAKGSCGGSPGNAILCESDAECPQGERCREAPGTEEFGIKICRRRRGGGGGGSGGSGDGSGPGGN
jgi:hypothetical protein